MCQLRQADRDLGLGTASTSSDPFLFVPHMGLSPSQPLCPSGFSTSVPVFEVCDINNSGNQSSPTGVSGMGVTGVLLGWGRCVAPRELSTCCRFLCVLGCEKGGSVALKFVGQRPNGELGFCGFVVDFGVSGDETEWSQNETKQTSPPWGCQCLAVTPVLAAAGPSKRPQVQNSSTARRGQGKRRPGKQ